MKNLTYLPFIRNRYFYGKLLTAEDFSQEQQYGNDKRRMLNRWMFGAGIVSGLEVIRVDDYSVSLEMGMALDHTGREIVVDTPVIRKLSLLEGYEEATAEEGDESLYLCIRYKEENVEPVQNVANRAVHTREEDTFNKVRESYDLYVTDEEPEESPLQEYGGEELRYVYDRAEQINQENYRMGIYLAKICLIKAGRFYMIDRIEPVPFQEYICCQPLLTGRLRNMDGRLKLLEEAREGHDGSGNTHISHTSGMGPQETGDAALQDWQFSQGSTTITFLEGGEAGETACSEELTHGLGLGYVDLILRVDREEYCYGGSPGMFPGSEIPVETGYRLKPSDGTFTIAVRLLHKMEPGSVRVGWTAIRNRSRNEFREGEGRIVISPQLVNVKIRETVELKVVCVNIGHPQLQWQVETHEGGTVDQNGYYQAPNRPGVYEISCRNREPEVKTSVYAVVRE